MKKIFIYCFSICFLLLLNFQKAEAAFGGGYKFQDTALIYTNTQFPASASMNTQEPAEKYAHLRRGESTVINVLGFVEKGNAGINKAAKNANITKIHYVDTQVSKIYVPLGFIPLSVEEIKTIVYGE